MLSYSIMLVESHPIFRTSLRSRLEQDHRLQVVAEASNAHEALHLADIFKPALVITDAQLPGVNGFQLASALRRERPDTAIVVLSMRADDDQIFAAIRSGAAALLTKNIGERPLVDALRRISTGENILFESVLSNPNLARRVMGDYRRLAYTRDNNDVELLLSTKKIDALDIMLIDVRNDSIPEDY